MIEIELKTRMGVIRGQQWGDTNKPVILALHGWLDNSASFEQFKQLEKDFHFIALDLPGHGYSDWLGAGGEYSIWSSLAPLTDIINQHPHLQDKPFYLLGHSMGAAIAVLLAAVIPERIKGIITLDGFGPLTTVPEQALAQLRSAVLAPIPKLGRLYATFNDALATRTKNTPGVSELCLTQIVERNLKQQEGGYQWRTDPRLRMPSSLRFCDAQLAPVLSGLTMPVLVLRAKQGAVPVQYLEKRLDQVANAQLIELEGHHHFHLEQDTAAAVLQAVQEFIRTLETDVK